MQAPTGSSVLINEKIAKTLDLEMGDKLVIKTASMESATVTVGGIFNSHVYNYIFMDSALYEGLFSGYEENTAFIKTNVGATVMGERLTAIDGITGITNLEGNRSGINDALGCLDYIIWLIVVFCAALAFVVTFNLTNINLAERSREIATVEVLGFYPRETCSYVLRENILLSFLASILGIPIGYAFHYMVMSMVVVDSFGWTYKRWCVWILF
jgi:putative ABC transport system permease protein